MRMTEHPGVVFREGPTGRRAGLVGGADVWEVVRAVKSARAAEPDLAAWCRMRGQQFVECTDLHLADSAAKFDDGCWTLRAQAVERERDLCHVSPTSARS